MIASGTRHRDALDDVLELADVAGPVVLGQQAHRLRRNLARRVAGTTCEMRQKMRRQRGNVLAPLAQRRHRQVNDVEAIEQVLAKRALGDHVAQVAVGRRDDADVDAADDAVGADLLQFAGFQKPEQQALHAQGHLADFVEEHRAPVGELELAELVAVGAGEAALDVTEQLGLEQRFGQAGAVDGDERPLGAGAAVVDSLRHQFLAGAAFSGDQHLGVGPRHALDLGLQIHHASAGANQQIGARASHRCWSIVSTCRCLGHRPLPRSSRISDGPTTTVGAGNARRSLESRCSALPSNRPCARTSPAQLHPRDRPQMTLKTGVRAWTSAWR